MKTAYLKNMEVNQRFSRKGIDISLVYIDALRRAELTLHRWSEMKCGDGNDYASWAIERDEKTNKPFWVTYPHNGESRRR